MYGMKIISIAIIFSFATLTLCFAENTATLNNPVITQLEHKLSLLNDNPSKYKSKMGVKQLTEEIEHCWFPTCRATYFQLLLDRVLDVIDTKSLMIDILKQQLQDQKCQ